jgi:hypothetical protein
VKKKYPLFSFSFMLILFLNPVHGFEKSSLSENSTESWYLGSAPAVGYFAAIYEKKNIISEVIHFETHIWQKEEGHLNHDHIKVKSQNNPTLTPIKFELKRRYRGQEAKYEGTVEEKGVEEKGEEKETYRQLTVLTPNSSENGSHSLSDRAFFSKLFPVWVHKNWALLESESYYSIETVIEDQIQHKFMPVSFQVEILKADRTLTTDPSKAEEQENEIRQVKVTHRGDISHWFLAINSSEPIKIEFPQRGIKIRQASFDEVKKHFPINLQDL